MRTMKPEVTMAEMVTYGADLTSITQGCGSFNTEMHHYDVVPGQLQEQLRESGALEARSMPAVYLADATRQVTSG